MSIAKYILYWKITIFLDGPTRSGVEEYEAMDVDDSDGGPGPQRCKIM